MRFVVVLGVCAIVSASAHAEPPLAEPQTVEPPRTERPQIAPHRSPPLVEPAAAPPRPIVGFVVRGDSKVRPRTLGYLSHTAIGDWIAPGDLPRIQQALLSSELFETVEVSLEPATRAPRAGVVVVVNATDKHSWIIAPTAFVLPGNRALGIGFAENDLAGRDQKVLLYGQLGTRTSLFFGTFLDPAVRGSKLTYRTDVYAYRRAIDEYSNPHDDPRSTAIARTTTATYVSAGALIGWNFLWWLVGDLRLRGAYVYFRDTQDGNGQVMAQPEKDGWDVTLQMHLTLDHRQHRAGVTWGSYVQLHLEPSIPGLDSYGYQYGLLRAHQSWALFDRHELELRGLVAAGRHLPLHEELALGGVSDLRGYDLDQFRGDLRAVLRAEYSVPIAQWRFLAFRAIGFYDAGYTGFYNRRTDRDYLPNQLGAGYARNDVGAGLRVYVSNIVLPLLGFDVGYGIESRSPELYFEVGLTDF